MNESLQVVRRFYSSLAVGAVPEALDLLDQHIEWTEAERSPYGGTVRGADAVASGVLQPINEDFDGFACTPVDFLTDGDRVSTFGSYTGTFRLTGEKLDAPFVHLWTVINGRIVRFVQFTDSAAWNEAFGSAGAFRRLRI